MLAFRAMELGLTSFRLMGFAYGDLEIVWVFVRNGAYHVLSRYEERIS